MQELRGIQMLEPEVFKSIVKFKFETVSGSNQYAHDSLARGEFELIKSSPMLILLLVRLKKDRHHH